MTRKYVKTGLVAAMSFAAAMTISATSAPAQMADMCAVAAGNICANNPYEFQDYDTCFMHYYRQYCPDWSEPNCIDDPNTGRTICP